MQELNMAQLDKVSGGIRWGSLIVAIFTGSPAAVLTVAGASAGISAATNKSNQTKA